MCQLPPLSQQQHQQTVAAAHTGWYEYQEGGARSEGRGRDRRDRGINDYMYYYRRREMGESRRREEKRRSLEAERSDGDGSKAKNLKKGGRNERKRNLHHASIHPKKCTHFSTPSFSLRLPHPRPIPLPLNFPFSLPFSDKKQNESTSQCTSAHSSMCSHHITKRHVTRCTSAKCTT